MARLNRERFVAYKCMELAGILRGRKRQRFMEELERRLSDNNTEADQSDRIIRAAQISYPQDPRTRKRYLRKRLKEWGRSVNPRSN